MIDNDYYPYGLPKNGPWMQNLNQPMAYQFNGIEKVDNFGLGVNMAVYRTLDPAVGRWWSVDPYAESFIPMSPYCAMNDSPLVYNDKDGGWVHIAIGAVIGGGVNVALHWDDIKNGGGWGAGFAAIGAGFVQGFAVGASSAMAGDVITQAGNAAFFDDQYDVGRTLLSGLIGGAVGYATVGPNVNPWTGKAMIPPTGSPSLDKIDDLVSMYGDVAGDVMFATGELPGDAAYAVSKIGSGKWHTFKNLSELDEWMKALPRAFPSKDVQYMKGLLKLGGTDDLKNAIQHAIKINVNPSRETTLLHLSARYGNLERAVGANIIDRGEELLELARIRAGFLNLLK